MTEELRAKVLDAILKTGYPLELELASTAEKNGWVVFHGVEYDDPFSGKPRELDLLIYKQIHQRRIEIRISCKSSHNKQFVFFTEDRTRYVKVGELKRTPVTDDPAWYPRIAKLLRPLPLFSHPAGVVNYTVVAGNGVSLRRLSGVPTLSLSYQRRGTRHLLACVPFLHGSATTCHSSS